jgi:putative ABC transport system ATP-binding protein
VVAADAPLIQLRGVTKTYGSGATQFQALKGIDLDIAGGDFVAVMGPSGSGKSTTMNILGCLDVPSGGNFLFRGHHVETLDRDQRAMLRRRYLGFVFQGFNLLSRTTALENVELPLLYRGEDKDAARDGHGGAGEGRARPMVGPYPRRAVGRAAARVAIARAIVTSPDVLLADEPTGNLDSERSVEIMELLTGLNRDSGITVLMVTHEPDMAAFARTVIHFKDGLVDRIEAQHRPGTMPEPDAPAADMH